jgi:hypothetical protein
MHTDEYEISLFRELDVCRKRIAGLQKKIALMERKHDMKTGVFIEAFNRGDMDKHNDSYRTWSRYCHAFGVWRERLEQYEEAFRSMKI